jgi:hypothetical protein
MVRVIFLLVLAAIPARGFADPAPRLFVAVQERDAVDRIVLRNTGDCALASGHLVLDMRASQGGVVIDTRQWVDAARPTPGRFGSSPDRSG